MTIKRGKGIKVAFNDVLNGFSKVKQGEIGIVQFEGDNDYVVFGPDDWGIIDNEQGPSRFRTVVRLRIDELNAFLVAAFGLTAPRIKNADITEGLETGEQLGGESAGTHGGDVPSERKPDGEGGCVPGPDDNHHADGRESDRGA
jgi:hypothetical protein